MAQARTYKRLKTRVVKVGNTEIGGDNPIRVQTMTTTDTMDTAGTVAQSIRCIEAGAELVRITAPSKNEAENLALIKKELVERGYNAPLIADIHFTPNAAEIAATLIEKVRVNPGNYVDKKKFQQIEYTDAEYAAEIDRIRERFTPLVRICKEQGTAMRIGTNHGSLSDRIMSRYGDTAIGMVESAMEFLRIARNEDYHQVILSMKSSNPIVMVEAYRLLVKHMIAEFGECYPLHLGVTEAGDGEDGRIKSAIGIGTLLLDGIGDTIRVSLTEDPEFEIPVCKDIVASLPQEKTTGENAYFTALLDKLEPLGKRQRNFIPGMHFPAVIADYMMDDAVAHDDIASIGYSYDEATDKWTIADAAADFIYTGKKRPVFALPGTLRIICDYPEWLQTNEPHKFYPLLNEQNCRLAERLHPELNFVAMDAATVSAEVMQWIKNEPTVIPCIYSSGTMPMQDCRWLMQKMNEGGIDRPVVLAVESHHDNYDEQLIHFSETAGALLLDGFGAGIWLMNDPVKTKNREMTGRTYLPVQDNHTFLNNTSFSILQAVRARISKTEYISCPSCGRTLFDLQETTAKIRKVTSHLKGLKIAIMGCIVNGPGEMADADYGYVGSGPGKITLYKSKEVVKRNISDDTALEELIALLKENNDWTESAV